MRFPAAISVSLLLLSRCAGDDIDSHKLVAPAPAAVTLVKPKKHISRHGGQLLSRQTQGTKGQRADVDLGSNMYSCTDVYKPGQPTLRIATLHPESGNADVTIGTQNGLLIVLTDNNLVRQLPTQEAKMLSKEGGNASHFLTVNDVVAEAKVTLHICDNLFARNQPLRRIKGGHADYVLGSTLLPAEPYQISNTQELWRTLVSDTEKLFDSEESVRSRTTREDNLMVLEP